VRVGGKEQRGGAESMRNLKAQAKRPPERGRNEKKKFVRQREGKAEGGGKGGLLRKMTQTERGG